MDRVLILLAPLLVLQQVPPGFPSRGAGTGTTSTSSSSAVTRAKLAEQAVVQRCIYAPSNAAATTYVSAGLMPVGTPFAFGTATSSATAALATTDLVTSTVRFARTANGTTSNFVSFTGESTALGFIQNHTESDAGGLYFTAQFAALSAAPTAPQHSVFVGLRADTSTASMGCSAPSAWLNSMYVGCDTTSTVLSVCSNDGSGSATCVPTSFSCTGSKLYTVQLLAHAGGGIDYSVLEGQSGVTETGTLLTDLPSQTTSLSWDLSMCSDAGAFTISWSVICVGFP